MVKQKKTGKQRKTITQKKTVKQKKIVTQKKTVKQKKTKQRWTGEFRGTAQGYGFVVCEKFPEDVFIPAEHTGSAFHGDQVEFELLAKGRRKTDRNKQANGRKQTEAGKSAGAGRRVEGKVVQVTRRAVTHVVGTYEQCNGFGFVYPDHVKFSKDIYIPAKKSKGALTGYKVVVELLHYGEKNRKPQGAVTEIIGQTGEPGTDVLSIVKGLDLPVTFPDKVLLQADRVGKEVSQADMAGREDLRKWLMVTIDGEDAKDLDDAVSLTKEGENYRLGVHIADVANYVQENSALDREALKRGTSVYLVDRVIPMLPTALSNGICSLNQGEDRLALSCIMLIDPKGRVLKHHIAETVICVNRRMTYTQVDRILSGKDCRDQGEMPELTAMLKDMGHLSAILRKRRYKRGSINFDFPESKVILDEAGKPIRIEAYERNQATMLIEDFMLLANETVAQEYFRRKLPFLYRTHENPDEDKIQALGLLISHFGYHLPAEKEVRPKELQKLLDKVSDTPQEALISRLVLRSMKQAKYTTENSGHFGLSARYYVHFTSPIRRYPDLQIHRIIKDVIRGRMNEKRKVHYQTILPTVAVQASTLERRAEEAERETVKLKKAEYMQMHTEEEFAGVISGVTAWGIYVELANTVEGLVHVGNLSDDQYEYVEERLELVGSHTQKTYRLGQPVRVKMLRADLRQRTIDFLLVQDEKDS